MTINRNRRFRLLYDGECPICRREVAWLKRRNRSGNLEFENIVALGFDSARYAENEYVVRVANHALNVMGGTDQTVR